MKYIKNEEVIKQFLKKFGEKIAEIRKAKNLTQLELATLCGSNVSSVSHAERGDFNIKISSLLLLSKALKTDIASFIDFPEIEYFTENILDEVAENEEAMCI